MTKDISKPGISFGESFEDVLGRQNAQKARDIGEPDFLIRSITKIKLEPGEKLLINLSEPLDIHQWQNLRDAFSRMGFDAHNVLVVAGIDMAMTKVSVGEDAPADALCLGGVSRG